MYTLVQVLSEVYPNIQFYSTGDDYADIVRISGDPLPSLTELIAARLDLTRRTVWTLIQAERTRRQDGGVYVSSVDKWFHSDQTSRIQQIGLVMMGNSMPTNINWKTMDGSFVVMSPALANSIFNLTATLDMTAFAVAEQHRQFMLQSPTPETYNFSAFWPRIFRE